MKTKLKWFCRHCNNCSGTLELDSNFVKFFTGDEIIKLVIAEHKKSKNNTIGGEVWIVMNIPNYAQMGITDNLMKMDFEIDQEENSFPLFVVLHIQ